MKFLGRAFILTLLGSVLGTAAWATPSQEMTTLSGRIIKSNGEPLSSSSVSFILSVKSADDTCILYQEQIDNVDMSNSKGDFEIYLGAGTRSFPVSAFTVAEAFSNGGTLNCAGGATYTPSATDNRKVAIQFYDGTAWKSFSPSLTLNAIPRAFSAASADKLGTNVAADFILKAGLPSCSTGTFLSWNGTSLSCTGVAGAAGGTVTDVTSTNSYLSVAMGSTTPALTVNVGTTAGTLAAGNDSRLSDSRPPNGTAGGNLSGTYPNPVVAKLQGTAVSPSAPGVGEVLMFDGVNWAPANLPAPGVGTVTSVSGTAPISVATGTTTPIISMSPATSGANGYLTSTDWTTFNSKQASLGFSPVNKAGDTMSGTLNMGGNKITNVSNVPFVATNPSGGQDGQSLRWNNTSSQWEWFTAGAAGAGVVSVTSANGDIGVANSTSAPVLTLNSGTSANQILKLDGSSRIPAVDGSQLTSLNPASLSVVVPVTKGGTGQSTFTDGQLLIGNSTGNTLTKTTLTAGTGISITNGAGSVTVSATGTLPALADGKIWVGQSGAATAVTPSGDATMSNAGVFSVGGVKGKTVSATPTLNGQVLRYDGTNWTPNFVSMFDLRSTVTGGSAFGGVGCTAGQTLTWTAATDNLSCSTIAIDASAVTSGTLPIARGGTGSSNGSITGSGALSFIAGGTNQNLTLAPSGTGVLVLSGNVGVGTTAPASKLDVIGEVKFGNSSSTCTSTNEGAQRYNSTSKVMEFCNGSAWLSTRGSTLQKAIFKTTGANTFTTPSTGTNTSTIYKFTIIGGGGGGGSGSGGSGNLGGFGGATAIYYGSGIGNGVSVSITVGSGGAGGTSGVTVNTYLGGGYSGGDSSIVFNGTTVTAYGGRGGYTSATAAALATAAFDPATTQNESIRIVGGKGDFISGHGGTSTMSAGGVLSAPGENAGGYGGGGGSGSNSGTYAGGAGSGGIVIVEWAQ